MILYRNQQRQEAVWCWSRFYSKTHKHNRPSSFAFAASVCLHSTSPNFVNVVHAFCFVFLYCCVTEEITVMHTAHLDCYITKCYSFQTTKRHTPLVPMWSFLAKHSAGAIVKPRNIVWLHRPHFKQAQDVDCHVPANVENTSDTCRTATEQLDKVHRCKRTNEEDGTGIPGRGKDFSWGGQTNFSRGETVGRFHFTNSKLWGKHFSTEELIGKYRISKSRGANAPPPVFDACAGIITNAHHPWEEYLECRIAVWWFLSSSSITWTCSRWKRIWKGMHICDHYQTNSFSVTSV